MPSEIDGAWLRQRYVDDLMPVDDIAAEGGVDVSTIYRALRREGIAPRGKPDHGWGEVFTAQHLRDLEAAGWTPHHIAQEYGCDWGTVVEWRGLRGLGTDDPVLRRWYVEEHLPIGEIAERLDVSRRTARRRLIASGIPLRRPGRRPRTRR